MISPGSYLGRCSCLIQKDDSNPQTFREIRGCSWLSCHSSKWNKQWQFWDAPLSQDPSGKNNIFFKHVKQQKKSHEVWEHPTVNIAYSSTLMVSKPFWKKMQNHANFGWMNIFRPKFLLGQKCINTKPLAASPPSPANKNRGEFAAPRLAENLGCGSGIRSLVVNQKYGGWFVILNRRWYLEDHPS